MFKVHSLKIEAELLRKVKLFCVSKGITMADFVREALSAWLKRNETMNTEGKDNKKK